MMNILQTLAAGLLAAGFALLGEYTAASIMFAVIYYKSCEGE